MLVIPSVPTRLGLLTWVLLVLVPPLSPGRKTRQLEEKPLSHALNALLLETLPSGNLCCHNVRGSQCQVDVGQVLNTPENGSALDLGS